MTKVLFDNQDHISLSEEEKRVSHLPAQPKSDEGGITYLIPGKVYGVITTTKSLTIFLSLFF